MLNFRKFLKEKREKIYFAKKTVDMLKNPTEQELISFLKRTKWKSARWIIFTSDAKDHVGDLYFMDSEDGIHHDMVLGILAHGNEDAWKKMFNIRNIYDYQNQVYTGAVSLKDKRPSYLRKDGKGREYLEWFGADNYHVYDNKFMNRLGVDIDTDIKPWHG